MINKDEKREIMWNIVNSLLAGSLVFLGQVTTGEISPQGAIISMATAGVVAISKFKNYWEKKRKHYKDDKTKKLFNFVGV